MKKLFCACLVALFAFGVYADDVLKPEVLALLQTSVFEIVTKKIENDPLTYEKELPLDRLPYAVRMDKFNPIGTAFLMSDGKFYTAAHVLQFTTFLQQDDFYIRDVNGNTYPIGDIIKFSTDRDFAIFTAKDFAHSTGAGLQFEKSSKLNSAVFAVGNAQGEGIVIRSGMLTSQTPENHNGEWQWLRFSAAASPGNSGGPLVDADGNVIGIITMKNQSENLNYALPVSELDSIKDNTGVMVTRYYYNVPNIISQRFYFENKKEFTLPSPIKTVRDACVAEKYAITKSFSEEQFKKFRFTGEESFATNDKGNSILYASFNPDFPQIMCMADNKKWGTYYPKTESLQLEDNGSVTFGTMLSMTMAYIHKPDSMSELDLITHPKIYMDYILKATPMMRYIGGEQIKITSYGEPKTSETKKDNLGRTWLVNFWDIPWGDASVLSYALPVPDGLFVIYVLKSSDDVYNGFVFDLQFLTDFIVTPNYGTIREWNEYLSIPKEVYPRPEFMQNATLTVNAKDVDINFAPLAVSLPAQTVAAGSDEDTFVLEYRYVPDAQKGLRQTVSAIALDTNWKKKDYHYFVLARVPAPHATSDKSTKDSWNQVHDKVAPFNEEPYDNKQYTDCNIVFNDSDESFDLLHLELQGTGQTAEMNEFKAAFKKVLGL